MRRLPMSVLLTSSIIDMPRCSNNHCRGQMTVSALMLLLQRTRAPVMSRLQHFIIVLVSDIFFRGDVFVLNMILVLATKNLIRLEQPAPYEPFFIAIN